MLTINWHAVGTQIVALIVLVIVVKKYLFGRVLDALDQRRNEVQHTFDQAEADRRAMEEARRDYEQRLRSIEEEARGHIQEAVKEAQQLREQIMTEAREQGESLIQHAREEIDREKRT